MKKYKRESPNYLLRPMLKLFNLLTTKMNLKQTLPLKIINLQIARKKMIGSSFE